MFGHFIPCFLMEQNLLKKWFSWLQQCNLDDCPRVLMGICWVHYRDWAFKFICLNYILRKSPRCLEWNKSDFYFFFFSSEALVRFWLTWKKLTLYEVENLLGRVGIALMCFQHRFGNCVVKDASVLLLENASFSCLPASVILPFVGLDFLPALPSSSSTCPLREPKSTACFLSRNRARQGSARACVLPSLQPIPSDTWSNFGVVLRGARTWTQWSLWVPFDLGDFMILCCAF